MNEYKIIIKGVDAFGLKFLHNVVEFTKKGAVISKQHSISNRFPHYVVMEISTNETLVSDIKAGITVAPVLTEYTKEQLEAMDWETFKKVLKKQFGLTGRDRDVLMTKYLQAVEEKNK